VLEIILDINPSNCNFDLCWIISLNSGEIRSLVDWDDGYVKKTVHEFTPFDKNLAEAF
jgi:hypothetical protein